MKLLNSGVQVCHWLEGISPKASWMGLCSFGFSVDLGFVRNLPQGSHILVGLPKEEEKHSTIIYRLSMLKKVRQDLIICTRRDLHAKYALVRLKKSEKRYALVGSANFTSSPAIETSFILEDHELYAQLAKRHERLLVGARVVSAAQPTPRLSPHALRALSSTPVTR